jgi:pyrimidine operon attenuation protein / uracil phosphoribosyltransferase
MQQQPTLLLNSLQIHQRIDRIAYQIYEDNFNEPEIIIAGIAKSGFVFAQLLQEAFTKLSKIPVRLIEIRLDKENPIEFTLTPSLSESELQDKVVIIADDVLNSGKTLIHSLRPFLEANTRKIRTVLLVNRDHKRYPVEADYVGITISTSLRDHIRVDLVSGREAVYME